MNPRPANAPKPDAGPRETRGIPIFIPPVVWIGNKKYYRIVGPKGRVYHVSAKKLDG